MAFYRQWTLYQMEILIHFHVSAVPFPRADAPLFPETLAGLISDRLLAPRAESGCYDTSDRGKALILMWMQTPLPEARFVDPRLYIEESA